MRLLADCAVNSDGSASSSRPKTAARSSATPRLADQDSAYWATKPAAPRTANSPTMATGTAHSGSEPRWKPLSSSGFIIAGTSGSVSELTVAASAATIKLQRLPRKYGSRRFSRTRSGAVVMPAARAQTARRRLRIGVSVEPARGWRKAKLS